MLSGSFLGFSFFAFVKSNVIVTRFFESSYKTLEPVKTLFFHILFFLIGIKTRRLSGGILVRNLRDVCSH